MAFENDDAGNAGTSPEVGSLPTSAPAAPPIPVSPSPATGAPPSSTNAAQPQPSPPPLVPSPAAPSRSFMAALAHSLIGSTLATATHTVKALAGPAAPDSYTTDASGKTTPNYRPDNTRSRLERLAQHALEGLAAGAQIGPQKSAAASWEAGIGAGAEAQRQQAQQQDLLKRKQSQEDYETQQKTLTDKAVRAAHNASTYSLWQKAMDEQNDHDPERKKNMDIVDSINDYNSRNPGSGLQVQVVSPEAAMAMREQDAHSVAKHTFLPLGMTQAKDANGQPLFEADGVTPKQTGQIAVISGGKAGDMLPLPQSFVDDLKEYGKMAGIVRADQIAPGTEVPLSAFINMDKRLNDIKRKEIDGWKETKAGENAVKVGDQLMQRNTVTGKLREYGGVPNVEDKPAAQAVETKLKAGQTAEAWAKAREADAKRVNDEGRHLDAFGNISPLNEKEFNKRYDAFNRSKQYQTLLTLQGSYQQFQETVNDLNSGKDLTGAASVVGLFNAIGISATPLAGKGFRINENTIREHVTARGIDQAAYQKLLSLETGAIITPDQIRDYASIAANVYRDSYINTANEEYRQIGIVDVLPRGNNQVIDTMTGRLYLTLAGNNPELAQEAAIKNGWVMPKGVK